MKKVRRKRFRDGSIIGKDGNIHSNYDELPFDQFYYYINYQC